MADLLDSVLATAGAAAPGALAISYGRRELGYAELARSIRAVSAGLTRRGLNRGDRVLFTVRPGPDAVVLALGIVHAGGSVVFADPGAGAPLFAARAGLAAPAWVAAESLLHLASARPLRRLALSRGLDLPPYRSIVPHAKHVYAGPWLPGVPRGAVSLRTLAATPDGGRQGPAAAERGGDEALIVFTSGTTAAPKAVVHTRASLGNGLEDFAAGVGLASGQRVLTDQLMVGIPALIAGATWVFPPHGASAGAPSTAYLDLLAEADVLFTPPATMDSLLNHLAASPERAPRHLKTIALGGAPVLTPLIERMAAAFPGAAIRSIYGMTEVLPVAIGDGLAKLAAQRDAATAAAADARDPGTASPAADTPEGGDPAGRVVPSVRARVEDGELILSGPGLALGYLDQLPANPIVEHRTGDLARLDGDHLTLLGRKKDMFIRGTQNVYPGLYEPIIAGLPGVADVILSGAPDEIGDDRLVLVLIPERESPSGLSADHPLISAVSAALPGLIDAGALPDVVLVIDAWPRSGRQQKVNRRELAAQVAAWLAAHPESLAGPRPGATS